MQVHRTSVEPETVPGTVSPNRDQISSCLSSALEDTSIMPMLEVMFSDGILHRDAGCKRSRRLQSRSASCLHVSAAGFGKSASFSVKVCTHTAGTRTARRPHARSAKMKVLSTYQSAHTHAFNSLVGGT